LVGCGVCTSTVTLLQTPAFTSGPILNTTNTTLASTDLPPLADAVGNLFVMSQDGSTISIYAPPYDTTPITVSPPGMVTAYAVDGQGALWIAWANGAGPQYGVTEYLAPDYSVGSSENTTESGAVSQIVFSP
jgi:hypothetical protein